MYTIENEYLSIGITKIGAELRSLKSKSSCIEYMWQANPSDWGNSAPILFPIIGGLKNGEYSFEGKTYRLPKHGLLRNSQEIRLINQQEDELTFSFTYNQDSLKLYPFKFEIQISYKLIKHQLFISHKILNLDSQSIFFSLGAHPAFNCPMGNKDNYSDYQLTFEYKETVNTWLLNDSGTVSLRQEQILDNNNKLPLTKTLFNQDALIIKDLKSREVTLSHKLSGPVLTLRFDDFNYLGIWAKPGTDFVCIEPWLGVADHENHNGDLKTKEGIIELPINQEYKASYSIGITE